MKLIFERSRPGRGNDLLPSLDVPAAPLPEKYRLPVHLFYYEGYSIKEAAAILGRREGTVRAQLTRARAMLRERLEAERT